MLNHLRFSLCSLGLASSLAFALVACDGGSGDPCQVETDCDDGLVCCGAARFGNPTRGVCAASCADLRDDASTVDATLGDSMMSMPDSSADSAAGDGAAGDGSTDSSVVPDADVLDAQTDSAIDVELDSGVADATPDAI